LYPYYLSYSMLILVAGICAAVVSIEIRRHVLAGLREAHTKAELSQVRKQLEIARQIQQSLLPREAIPVAGYELAAWNRPADETGGDYYDWIPLSDGRCAIIIADVTGHGIGSALLMAVCRAYARASMPNLDPLRAAMRQLNELLCEDVGLGRFVTFAVAILSPNHDEVELLSAGHGPTLVCRRASGTIETFDGDGLPLGVMPKEEFDEPRRIRMSQGDTLLLITDGFMEAHNANGEQFGMVRLSQSLASHAKGDITQIVSRIDCDVRAFAKSHPQTDDMTAVIIRRTT
jgi:serine phosphatase RsbU (regulator of sigma subunit)